MLVTIFFLVNKLIEVINLTAYHVKKLLSLKHGEDFFACEVKTGPSYGEGLGIIDAWAMKKSWAHPQITGYEIKISRQDFLKDDKWRKYLDYCNVFYFVCPKDIIKPGELPDGIGLMNVSKGLRIVRKAAYRDIKIHENIFRYILMNKIESDRYPFHDSKLSYWQDYIAGKKTSKDLSYLVNSKLIREINELKQDTVSSSHIKELEKIEKLLDDNNVRGFPLSNRVENLFNRDTDLVEKLKKFKELRDFLNNLRF